MDENKPAEELMELWKTRQIFYPRQIEKYRQCIKNDPIYIRLVKYHKRYPREMWSLLLTAICAGGMRMLQRAFKPDGYESRGDDAVSWRFCHFSDVSYVPGIGPSQNYYELIKNDTSIPLYVKFPDALTQEQYMEIAEKHFNKDIKTFDHVDSYRVPIDWYRNWARRIWRIDNSLKNLINPLLMTERERELIPTEPSKRKPFPKYSKR